MESASNSGWTATSNLGHCKQEDCPVCSEEGEVNDAT